MAPHTAQFVVLVFKKYLGKCILCLVKCMRYLGLCVWTRYLGCNIQQKFVLLVFWEVYFVFGIVHLVFRLKQGIVYNTSLEQVGNSVIGMYAYLV